MELNQVIESLDRSIPMIERHLDARLAYVERAIEATALALDALDRAIQHVDDDRSREHLRRQLQKVDESTQTVSEEVRSVSTRDALDPIRALSIDLKVELRHPERTPTLPL